MAIFMVDGTADLNALTALIIHEMVHAYQMENNISDFQMNWKRSTGICIVSRINGRITRESRVN